MIGTYHQFPTTYDLSPPTYHLLRSQISRIRAIAAAQVVSRSVSRARGRHRLTEQLFQLLVGEFSPSLRIADQASLGSNALEAQPTAAKASRQESHFALRADLPSHFEDCPIGVPGIAKDSHGCIAEIADAMPPLRNPAAEDAGEHRGVDVPA